MRVVVDTNVIFSGILNTNSRIARVILQPRSGLNFYSTECLLYELDKHFNKMIKLSGYSKTELERLQFLFCQRIKFINVGLIPRKAYDKALSFTHDVDIEDTEFVALTEHIRGRLWSGDKELIMGLEFKGWTKFISTEQLYQKLKL